MSCKHRTGHPSPLAQAAPDLIGLQNTSGPAARLPLHQSLPTQRCAQLRSPEGSVTCSGPCGGRAGPSWVCGWPAGLGWRAGAVEQQVWEKEVDHCSADSWGSCPPRIRRCAWAWEQGSRRGRGSSSTRAAGGPGCLQGPRAAWRPQSRGLPSPRVGPPPPRLQPLRLPGHQCSPPAPPRSQASFSLALRCSSCWGAGGAPGRAAPSGPVQFSGSDSAPRSSPSCRPAPWGRGRARSGLAAAPAGGASPGQEAPLPPPRSQGRSTRRRSCSSSGEP